MKKVILAVLAASVSGCASWGDFHEGVAMSLQALANNRGQQAAYYQGLSSQQTVDYYQQQPKSYYVQPIITGNGGIGGYSVRGN